MLLGLVRPSAGTGTVLGGRSIAPPLPGRRRCAHRRPAFYPGALRPREPRGAGHRAAATTRSIPDLLELVGPGRPRRRPLPQLLARHEAAARHRCGAAGRSRAAHPRRAGQRPRPAGRPGDADARRPPGRTGRTVLVSSHDLSELEQVCDWLVLIDQGPGAVPGPDGELLDDRGGRLAGRPGADRRPPSAGRPPRSGARPPWSATRTTGSSVHSTVEATRPAMAAVNRTAFDAGIVLVELSPVRATLEDRYCRWWRTEAR